LLLCTVVVGVVVTSLSVLGLVFGKLGRYTHTKVVVSGRSLTQLLEVAYTVLYHTTKIRNIFAQEKFFCVKR